MTEPTYFTVVGDFRAFIADGTADGDANPDSSAISATVTFKPLVNSGDVILATDATPRPTGFIPAPVVATIGTDGRLKLRTTANGDYPFTPVRLLANSPLLELDSPLFYTVSFTAVTYGGISGSISPFTFEAPDADIELNLIEVFRQPGQPATGITKIAPGGVRLDGTDLVFSFDGSDIPSPVSLAGLAGPTGATGSTGATGATGATGSTGPTGATGTAATISVGTVSTGAAGSTAGVTNVGTSSAATFNFTIPRGDKGETGNTGSTGSAATVSVGTVSTGNAGSSASVTNVGSSSAATLNFAIPRGDKGDKGDTGNTGSTGSAATIAVGTVTTVAPGSSASVTNVGTSSAAVFDISIPKGDTGSAESSTWTTISGRPTIVAAGATKADARAAIDAEDTGARGVANGTATLDSAGKVPYSQLPASIMSYQGTVNMSTGVPALADGTGDQGDVYRVSVAGTRNLGSGSIAWGVGDYAIYNGSTWEKSDSTDAVASVNGYTGTVTLAKSDVGLGSVDNTSDAGKPISTATQTALDAKEPTISGGSAGQYWDGTKTWTTLNKSAVGLGNVDNTTDVGKPISTATQTALDAKEATISAGTTAQYYRGDKTFQTLDQDAVPSGTTNKVYTATEQTKLAGIATAATANSADATLLARSNHTGTQTASTISDFSTAADGRITAAVGTSVVGYGGALGTPSSGVATNITGQVADVSIVAFGAATARAAASYGDFPFGIKLQRAVTFSSVTFRAATADASGNLVVELRKNGTQVSGSSTTIAAASQVAGGTSTGTWAFAAGDIITVYVTGIGTTPGKGLIADVKGVTA
jgi:hypothetical protein